MVGYSKARGEPDTNWVSQPDVYMTYTDLGIYRIYIYIYYSIYIYTYTFKIIYIYIHMCLMNIQLWFKYDILYTVYIYIHCMEGLSFSLYIYIYICFGWIFKCIIYNIRINPTSICKYIYMVPPLKPTFLTYSWDGWVKRGLPYIHAKGIIYIIIV